MQKWKRQWKLLKVELEIRKKFNGNCKSGNECGNGNWMRWN